MSTTITPVAGTTSAGCHDHDITVPFGGVGKVGGQALRHGVPDQHDRLCNGAYRCAGRAEQRRANFIAIRAPSAAGSATAMRRGFRCALTAPYRIGFSTA